MTDGIVERAREQADDILDAAFRWEREEQSRSPAALLPLEREQTGRYLLTERGPSDDAVAHQDNFLGMVSHDLRNLLAGIGLHAHRPYLAIPDSVEGWFRAASSWRARWFGGAV